MCGDNAPVTKPDPASTGRRPLRGATATEAPAHAAERPSASVPVRPAAKSRRHNPPLGWLPWALLAALLALLALMLLAGTLVGGSGDPAGSGSGSASSGGSGQAGDAGQSGRSGTAGGSDQGGPGAGATGGGTLTAGTTDLLASPAAAAGIRNREGRPVTGQGVTVESVVADEGFWVGTSARQRVFVFLTPEARRSAGESGYQVEPGQRVGLQGTVKGLGGAGPSSFGVSDAEGARLLEQQAAYVAATSVSLTP